MTSSVRKSEPLWLRQAAPADQLAHNPLDHLDIEEEIDECSRPPAVRRVNGTGRPKCALCEGEHFILFCPSYKTLGLRERKDRVIEKNLCFNCLAAHSSRECKSSKRCQLCLGKHHTTIHIPLEPGSASGTNSQVTLKTGLTDQGVSPPLNSTTPTTHCAQTQKLGAAVLLATALVRVASITGEKITIRALIDPCSGVLNR